MPCMGRVRVRVRVTAMNHPGGLRIMVAVPCMHIYRTYIAHISHAGPVHAHISPVHGATGIARACAILILSGMVLYTPSWSVCEHSVLHRG